MEKNTVDRLIQVFPREVQGAVAGMMRNLPPEERKAIEELVKSAGSNSSLMKLMVKLTSGQLRAVYGNLSRVAIVGPANAGKSTLYNQFIHEKSQQARVSPLPGTTRVNQSAEAELFCLVDTPGADAVGDVGEEEKTEALRAAREGDFLIILFDAIQGIKKSEKEIYAELVALGKPYIVALNKIDLVKAEQTALQKLVAEHLGLDVEQVVLISAATGKGLEQLVVAVAAAEPRIVAALGRALPEYRWKLAWRNIISAASISAAIALVPLPVVDFAPLVVNQSTMVLGIARVYDYKLNLERARELVVTFGLGFLGRVIFQEISKLGGVPGWVLSAAIASSTTVVMGYAAAQWFEKGRKLTPAELNRLTRSLTGKLVESLKHIGKKKPGREKLRDAIEESLDNLDISE